MQICWRVKVDNNYTARERNHMKQMLTAALLLLAVGVAPALAAEPSQLPQAGGMGAVLAEEPAQNEDIKTIMVRYKQGEYLEKIPSMPLEQRRKLMAYYKKAREAGVKDRLVATGLGSIVVGYSDIEAIRDYVEMYKKREMWGSICRCPTSASRTPPKNSPKRS